MHHAAVPVSLLSRFRHDPGDLGLGNVVGPLSVLQDGLRIAACADRLSEQLERGRDDLGNPDGRQLVQQVVHLLLVVLAASCFRARGPGRGPELDQNRLYGYGQGVGQALLLEPGQGLVRRSPVRVRSLPLSQQGGERDARQGGC